MMVLGIVFVLAIATSVVSLGLVARSNGELRWYNIREKSLRELDTPPEYAFIVIDTRKLYSEEGTTPWMGIVTNISMKGTAGEVRAKFKELKDSRPLWRGLKNRGVTEESVPLKQVDQIIAEGKSSATNEQLMQRRANYAYMRLEATGARHAMIHDPGNRDWDSLQSDVQSLVAKSVHEHWLEKEFKNRLESVINSYLGSQEGNLG